MAKWGLIFRVTPSPRHVHKHQEIVWLTNVNFKGERHTSFLPAAFAASRPTVGDPNKPGGNRDLVQDHRRPGTFMSVNVCVITQSRFPYKTT